MTLNNLIEFTPTKINIPLLILTDSRPTTIKSTSELQHHRQKNRQIGKQLFANHISYDYCCWVTSPCLAPNLYAPRSLTVKMTLSSSPTLYACMYPIQPVQSRKNQWRPNFIDPPPIVNDMGQCKFQLVGHDNSKFVRDRSFYFWRMQKLIVAGGSKTTRTTSTQL